MCICILEMITMRAPPLDFHGDKLCLHIVQSAIPSAAPVETCRQTLPQPSGYHLF